MGKIIELYKISGISVDVKLDWCHACTVMLTYLLMARQVSGVSVD